MNKQEKFNKCVTWLLNEWLEEDGVFFTECLYRKAEKQVNWITKHQHTLDSKPLSELPWYEVDKICEIYYEGDI